MEPYPLLLPLWYVLVIQGVHQQVFDLTSGITQIYNFKSAASRKKHISIQNITNINSRNCIASPQLKGCRILKF